MNRARISGAAAIVFIIAALCWATIAHHHWTRRSEIQQGQQSHRQLILEELDKIQKEERNQSGWQTSLQDLPH